MKKFLLFLLSAASLLTFNSCDMEKRLYRNGWYMEKSKQHSFSSKPVIVPEAAIKSEIQSEESARPDSVSASPAKTDSVISPVELLRSKIKQLRETKKESQAGDPIIKMTYAEARASMAKQGCKPHRFAMTVYILSVLSIALCWLAGLGLFLGIISLILSFFAINKVAASGSCVEENIAIIQAGRRMSFILLLAHLVILILVIALVLLITYRWGGF